MDKKSLIYSIIAVLLIGLIVSGSTFAYFQWSSGIDDRAGLNITIEQSGITMHIEPENTVYTNLRPTAYCNNAYAYGDALVTVVNNTGAAAVPSFKLKVKVTKNGTGELTQEVLSHIHYSVVVPNQDEDGDLVGTEQPLCNHLISDSFSDDDSVFFKSDSTDTWTNQFNFGSVNTDGSWTHVPNNGDETFYFDSNGRVKQGDDYIANPAYLPRQYYVGNYNGNSKGDTKGITFIAAPHATTTQRLRVYVWIDEHYTATNIGGVVSDPLQNAKIEVTWSEQSTVQQVPSESTGGEEEVKEAGSYDSEGNFTTWDTLVTNGDITVSADGVITASNAELTGELVIPNSVTALESYAFADTQITNVVIPDSVITIGESAFWRSSLTSVIIGDSVETIGKGAFEETNLTSVVIPNSVTTIGERAFYMTSLTNVTIGNSVQTIGNEAFANIPITSVVIPDSVTTIGNEVFSRCYYLENVVIGNSVQTIGEYAFYMTNLTSVIIPDSVISIGSSAFEECMSLEVVEIGNSVTSIENNTFTNCSNLYFILIPDSVTKIGIDAFANTQLSVIYYSGTEEEWNTISIDNTNDGNNPLFNASVQYNYIG